MAVDHNQDQQRDLPNQPALDEGNVPGTPSTKGVGIIIAALLIGAGFLLSRDLVCTIELDSVGARYRPKRNSVTLLLAMQS